MKRLQLLVTAFLLLILSTSTFAIDNNGVIDLNSPDKKINVTIGTDINGRLSYSIKADKTTVVNTSPLGITIDNVDLGIGAKIVSTPATTKINETYSIYGNHAVAHNKANEFILAIEASGKKYQLIVRVYNDGVAIRYTIPAGSKYINGESTAWSLPENVTKITWSEFSACYEGLSHVTTIKNYPTNNTFMAPVTVKEGNHFICITEADCENFSDMAIIRDGHTLKVDFPFSRNGWDIQKRDDNPLSLNATYLGQNVSPWRTTIIARNLTDLINSDILTNLCPKPVKGTDYSWVQPGRCLWEWWSVGAPVYEDQKNWYDAAAKLKWEYYLVDEGWSDWRQPGKDQWALLAEVIAYGKKVGVKSLVWVNSNEIMDAKYRRTYLEKVKSIGADGIKIDFVAAPNSDIMQWYMGTMQDCSEIKLLLNFHGSVKPTGLRRTYPNDLTREAVRGDEYHMTRYWRVAPLTHDVSLPFTRLMAGPADITPVILNPSELKTANYTWPHEFAQAIVFLSPITHFADHYKYYLESPMYDLFQQIPTVWDETRVLSCTEMGEVVAYARRKDKTWWIGVMNGTTERDIIIPLNFLKKTTKATLIYDRKDNIAGIDRHEQIVSSKDILKIHMAPGGGFIAKL